MHSPRRTARSFAPPQTSGQGFSSLLFTDGTASRFCTGGHQLHLPSLHRPKTTSPVSPWDPQVHALGAYTHIWNHHRPWVPNYSLALNSLFTCGTWDFLVYQAQECFCFPLFYFVRSFDASAAGGSGSPLLTVLAAVSLDGSRSCRIGNCEMITSENRDDYSQFCQMTTAHIFFQPREQFLNCF